MKIRLSLKGELVKTIRKIAVERHTTLTGMVRDYLKAIVAEDASSGKRRQRDALERSFKRFQFKSGNRSWKRADLYIKTH